MPSAESGAGSVHEAGLVQRLRRRWSALSMPGSPTVIVGYSGGADSLALLHAMASLQRTGALSIVAVHVDHGVRPEANRDAAIASEVGERIGVSVRVHQVSAESLARHGGVGREEAYRRERYAVFASVTSAVPGALVALAHHEQDQAETVLLHLLRGAGLRGASGMRELHTMRVPWWDAQIPAREVTVWRPFLEEARGTVRDYALSLGLPIAEDSSNADPVFRRNAIRHEVLPLMERVSPGSTSSLARFAALAGSDNAFLDQLADKALREVASGSELGRVAVLSLPLPLQRRVVQAWLVSRGPAGLEVPLHRLEEILQVADRPGAERRVEIGQGVTVVVTREMLELYIT